MLTQEEAESLSERMMELSCTNPKAGEGLFGFVLGGEQGEKKSAYERHVSECEYCGTALQVYRYKRDAARLLNKWETAREIVDKAKSDSGILKRDLGNGIAAYFQGDQKSGRGTTVVVDSLGKFLSVEEQSVNEFQEMIFQTK